MRAPPNLTKQKQQHKVRPSMRAIAALAGLGSISLTLALLAHWLPGLAWVQSAGLPLFALLILLLLMGAAYITTSRQPAVKVTRRLPSGLALNQWVDVELSVQHEFGQATFVIVHDGVSQRVVAEGICHRLPLQPGRRSELRYRLRPLQRGQLLLERCHIKLAGPLGLWLEQYSLPVYSSAKVYPNFSAITSYSLLASENQTAALGIRSHSRRGLGSAFHQLREYRQGDSLRQLDWSATAKRLHLISKEYQEERDQNVIIMIDSGRRMRSQDGELTHFDHALNASILISYIALRQGDSVGLMSFGHEQRWLAPQKGVNRVNVILNGVYDLQAGRAAPDYLSAAENLVTAQRKRSLIILLTNSRDEEIDELLLAVNLMQKRHLVMVANLRETHLDKVMHSAPDTPAEAQVYVGTVEYMQRRAAMQMLLQARGVLTVDATAEQLPAKLVNSYWEVKRAGAL